MLMLQILVCWLKKKGPSEPGNESIVKFTVKHNFKVNVCLP